MIVFYTPIKYPRILFSKTNNFSPLELPIENDLSPECDYNGLVCLDTADLIFPRTTIMQPWRTRPNVLACSCMPSCTEHEVKLVGIFERFVWYILECCGLYNCCLRCRSIPESTRKAIITLQALPIQRYRRQAVKDDLDIVGWYFKILKKTHRKFHLKISD